MTGRALPLSAALLLPILLAGAARQDPLAGRVAQAPVDCIDDTFVSGPEIVDAHTILYRSPSKIYRTGPVGDCPALEPVATLIVEEKIGSQTCKNDFFRVLRQGEIIPSNVCRFNAFTPYVKADKAK